MLINCLRSATTTLKNARIPCSSLDAEILLSYALQRPKEFLYAHPEYEMTEAEIVRYNAFVCRRIAREPVAYIIHKKEFYGYEFYVDKHVLIPRGETEVVVEKILRCIHSKFQIPNSKFLVADVGTGSGCIITSIVNELKKQNIPLQHFSFIGSDSSADALAVASLNAKRNRVEKYISFYQGNLLEPLYSTYALTKEMTLIIAANLPYITPSQYQTLQPEIVRYEPRGALVTPNENALHFYEELNKQVETLKKKTNARVFTYYENCY